MTSDTPQERPSPQSPGGSGRDRPERPGLRNTVAAPVIVKQPPPLSVRVSQLAWALSLVAGGAMVVYYFVIREDLFPLIVEAARAVDGSRVDETYTSVADTIYWSFFALFVALILVQLTLLVSFANRRNGARWWQLATVIALAALYAVVHQLVGDGEHGVGLRQLGTAQVGLAILGLLVGAFPGAIAWTARKYDVRDGTAGSTQAEY